MRIGTRFNATCAPFILTGAELKFVHEVKYLGVYMVVGTVAANHLRPVSYTKIKFLTVLIHVPRPPVLKL